MEAYLGVPASLRLRVVLGYVGLRTPLEPKISASPRIKILVCSLKACHDGYSFQPNTSQGAGKSIS